MRFFNDGIISSGFFFKKTSNEIVLLIVEKLVWLRMATRGRDKGQRQGAATGGSERGAKD
jgi:hypothetical protein